MNGIILFLFLLLCLCSAFLQPASGEQQIQALNGPSNKAIGAGPEEVQVSLLKKTNVKKNRKNRRRRNKKEKRKQPKNGKKKNKKTKRRKNRGKKRTRKSKKGKKKNGRKSGRNNRKQMKQRKPRRKSRKNKQWRQNAKLKQSTNSTCNIEGLRQKLKNYIKYSNQLRKLKRINKTCTTMEKKRDKAGGGEFNASAQANADSGNDTVNKLAEELKNCTTTAKANCEITELAACTNITRNTKCEKELSAWFKKFGPGEGSCLSASKSCCKCINNIKPDPSPECLTFDALDNASKEKKKKCVGSGTQGSFGYCRKLEMEAAETGPTAHQAKCIGKGTVTKSLVAKKMLFRNNLLKKLSTK